MHSNQNCLITINNINQIFSNITTTTTLKTPKKIVNNGLFNSFTNVNSNNGINSKLNATFGNFDEMTNENIKRKLIIVDGSHDIIAEENSNVIGIVESFLSYLRNKNM